MTPTHFKNISFILTLVFFTCGSGMDADKDSLESQFWQESNREQVKSTLSTEHVRLIGQVLKVAAGCSSLKGKKLKDTLHEKFPVSEAEALLLLEASYKTNYRIGLQYAAYALMLKRPTKYYIFEEYYKFDETMVPRSVLELREPLDLELNRQRYLISHGKTWDDKKFFSVRELHDHECIAHDSPHLKELRLDKRLNSLDGLEHYPDLESFSVSAGKIEAVYPSDTQSSTSLVKLTLFDNCIKEIPGIRSLTALTTLNLSVNRLTDTALEPLQGLSNLTDLNLSANYLRTVRPLAPLANLQALSVSRNYITHMSPQDMCDFKQLTTLIAARNGNIDEGAVLDIEGLFQLVQLKHLNLCENDLPTISPAITNLTNLQELYLSENNLITLDGLVRLTTLKQLEVCHNQLTVITPQHIEDLKKLSSLYRLSLGGNHVPDETKTHIQEALPKMKYLNFSPYMRLEQFYAKLPQQK